MEVWVKMVDGILEVRIQALDYRDFPWVAEELVVLQDLALQTHFLIKHQVVVA
jgi:hypothetical protein